MASSRPLQQRRFSNANVVYLTLPMRFAVRALSVCLTAWLTIGAAVPPCCWSMANGHDHHQGPTPVDGASAAHEHHGHMAGATMTPAFNSIVRQDVQHPCDAAPADTVATSTASLSRADVPTLVPTAESIVPQSSRAFAHPPDLSPPGAPPGSAFLIPFASDSSLLESHGWPEGQHYERQHRADLKAGPAIAPARSADL